MRLHVLGLVLAGVIACLATGAQTVAGEVDRSSPESVFKAFVGCVEAGDFGGALDLFDFAEQAENTDFFALHRQTQVINSYTIGPGQYPAFAALNRSMGRRTAARQIQLLVFSLLLAEKFPDIPKTPFYPFTAKNPRALAGEIAAFVKALNPDRLKGLVCAEFFRLDDGQPEQYSASIEKLKKIHGYQDFADCLAVYELNGKRYVGGVMFSRYGDAWRIQNLRSNLAGTPNYGGLVEVDSPETRNLLDLLMLMKK